MSVYSDSASLDDISASPVTIRDFHFVGLGLDEGLSANVTNFVEEADLPESFFLPRSERLRYPDLYRWWDIFSLKKNLKNHRIIRKMDKNEFKEALFEDDIDCFVGLDNFLLTRRLFVDIKNFYEGNYLTRPFTVQYTPTTKMFLQFERNLLDKVLLSSPPEEFTRRNFPLSKAFVGIQGLYDAFEFLLKQDPEFSDLILEDGMYIPRQVIRTITDEMVYRLRVEERALLELGERVVNPRTLRHLHLRVARRHAPRAQKERPDGPRVGGHVERPDQHSTDAFCQGPETDHQCPRARRRYRDQIQKTVHEIRK